MPRTHYQFRQNDVVLEYVVAGTPTSVTIPVYDEFNGRGFASLHFVPAIRTAAGVIKSGVAISYNRAKEAVIVTNATTNLANGDVITILGRLT